MNKHLYRIVFNKRRGQLMVVADNVKSAGKQASGEAGSTSDTGLMVRLAITLRPGFRTMYAAFGMLSCLALQVDAQIVADPNAPGSLRPTVLQTPNGVPLVNIQTPSSAGVSRNVYNQFDVTAKGAVLNNSRTDVQSQIGGWVQGNPWLAGGSARVILNEVNSVNPSRLNGYVEIAGQRAELVIANPAGVSVDGGGFINASKVTITTGAPRMNGGSLDGYLVQRGMVTIGERGLDGTEADYVGILGRAVEVNGSIWAKELQVIGGANQIDASQKTVTTGAADGETPSFALDVAHLGGMYAGKITLIGTEAGVGMRNAGTIVTSAGDLVLGSNGWLTNSGTIHASAPAADARLDVAGNIINTGTVYAGRDTRIRSAGDIANTGLIAARNDSTILATGAASRIEDGGGGTFASGMRDDGSLGASGDTRIDATQAISFHGVGTAAGNIQLRSAQIDLSDASLSGTDLVVDAIDGGVNATGSNIDARGALALRATASVRTDGARVGANVLDVTAHDFFNVGGQVAQFGNSDLTLVFEGNLDNTSGKIAANSRNVTLGASSVLNGDGEIEHAGAGTLAITAESMKNQGGQISANGDTVLTLGAGLDNTEGEIASRANLTILAAETDNRRGLLQGQAGDVSLHISDFNNVVGTVVSGGDLDTIANKLNNSGSMYASGEQRLAVSGTIDNSGVIAAQGNTVITAQHMSSTEASLLGAGIKANAMVASAGDLSITTSGELAAHGQNLAAGQVRVTGASVDVGGSRTSAAAITLEATARDVSTRGAAVKAAGTLAVTARQDGQVLANTGGSLSARQLDVQVAGVDNRSGEIIQTGAGDTSMVLTSASGRFDNTDGRITLNSASFGLGAAKLDNTGGKIEHAGTGVLSIDTGGFDGERGRITGNGAVLITASDLNHNAATTSGRTLSVRADSMTNRAGHLLQSGAGELALQVAHQIDNAGGEVAADGGLAVQGGSIDNSGGHFTSAASAQVAAAASLDNTDGVLAAGHALTVAAQRLENSRGVIEAGVGALSLRATNLLNSSGTISAGADLTAAVTGELRNGGMMYAGRDHELNVDGAFTNSGSVAAAGNTTIKARSVDSGPGALLGAGIEADGRLAQLGRLTVSADDGLLAAGQNLAAGDMSLIGARVDLGGSETSAANIALTATGGGVITRYGRVSTTGKLTVTANSVATQTLDNGQGSLSAGELALNVANLSNDHGAIIQTGSTDTNIVLSELHGTLDNTDGRITTNGGSLLLGAGTFVNKDGKIEHAGTGALSINAEVLNDQRGQIAANGALAITAGEFDHRSANTAAQKISIAATNLDNRSGQIAQLGIGHTEVTASGALDNSNGKIESNGDALIGAALLRNIDGRIGAVNSAVVGASESIDNTDGHIIAGANLTLEAGDVDNVRGVLQAQEGDLTVNMESFRNLAGNVYAGRDLNATASDIDNSGSLYSAGNQRLVVTGRIINSGVIAAQGHATISANSLTSTSASLLAAGLKADGSSTQTGDLSVTADAGLTAAGQNLAAGEATLIGANVDISGSQTSARGIALHASIGNVSTSGAAVVATDTLAIAARNVGQTLVNSQGTLSAGQLAVEVANLDNKQGTIIQSGVGETRIVLTTTNGRLDNSSGRVAINGVNLTLGGTTLVNTDGRIEHAGTGALDIATSTLDGRQGQITSNGTVLIKASDLVHDGATTVGHTLSVQADSLSNRSGHVLQSGAGQMALQVMHKIDNAGGEIAADGNLEVQAGAIDNNGGRLTAAASAQITSAGALNNNDGILAAAHALTIAGQGIDNTHGEIQAGAGALSLSAASLLNSEGTITAGTDLTATVTGDLHNSGTLYAGRDQVLEVGGTFTNSRSVAALGNATISAGRIDSGHDSMLGAGIHIDGSFAQSGTLTVNAQQGLRTTGQNLAAGNLQVRGGSVDIGNSESVAANISITATTGSVSTEHASVNTAGTLSVTANAAATQVLNNAHGNLTAGQLALDVANLNNDHGTILQTGGTDTDITLSGPSGTFDNTFGRIATNGGNLTLGAATLVNSDGKIEHAGAGTLAVNAATLRDQRGQIIANGSLDIAAGELDHRGATTAAQQVKITATNVDNRSGKISQLGIGLTSVKASGNLDNGGGRIESNGDAMIETATLKNMGGLIGALGSATVAANASLDNTEGLVAAGTDLHVLAGEVDNSHGFLQAQAGAATLQVSSLNNTAGSVYASGDLDVSATYVTNSGSLYATGDQRLVASGGINNSGVIAAHRNTTVIANSLSSSSAALLGAGVNADGILAPTGDLNVTTFGELLAYGQNLAGNRVTLAGASVDLTGSKTGAAEVNLLATGGNVVTNGATVVAERTLAITAVNDGQSLVNVQGTLSASQLRMQLANLNNTRGTIIQSGQGDTSFVLTSDSGALDNTSGRIAANSVNLTLGAATLTNADGRIEHAGEGTLSIAAATLAGEGGRIEGNGSVRIAAGNIDHHNASLVARKVSISADSLDNRLGSIVQLGTDQGSVSVSGRLDNRSGEITSNGNTTISAGSLFNQGGKLQATDIANLNVAVNNVLDNRDGGSIAAGANATLTAGSILNHSGGITAGATLSANAAAVLQNSQGFLAGSDVRLAASTLSNNGGMIAAVLGDVSATTVAVLDNASGVIQAAHDIALQTGGIKNNSVGNILGRDIEIATNGQLLNNQLGTIAATGILDINSGELNNDAGLLRAGTTLAIDTSGQSLSNTDSAEYGLVRPDGTGGIVSDGAASLRIGNWYNAGGFFGAKGVVTGSTGLIDNTQLSGVGGRIVGESSLNLTMAGLDNQGGQIQALGDLTLNAANGVIDNRGSLIRSGATLTLTAETIDNRGTLNYGFGVEGQDVRLGARMLDNNEGAIRADSSATINVIDSFANDGGLVSAGTVVNVADPGAGHNLAIVNTGGTIIGGTETNIHATTLTGDGKLLSLGDMTIDLRGEYVQRASGEITANNNVTISVGDLSNYGKLRAGANLTINARNIDNAVEGDISASRTRIHAANVLSNRGVIDGVDTQVDAGTVNNIGTGRIYGDHLSMAAREVNNQAEGGTAATIAARSRLDIGTKTLNNSEHALIFSGGDMSIGGALGSYRIATGRAENVTNASATIEALGELNLGARQVNNLNNHFSVELADVGAPSSFAEYQGISSINPNGVTSPTRYLAGTPGVRTYNDGQFEHLETPEALWNDRWAQYDITRTTRETVIKSSDPGRIASGGDLIFDADIVLNENSHILAGGQLGLDANVLNNTETAGQRITSDSVKATLYKRHYRSGNDSTDIEVSSYTLPDDIKEVKLNSSRVEGYTASGGMGVPGAVATVAVSSATSAAGSAEAAIDPSSIVSSAANVATASTATGQGADIAEGVGNWSAAARAITSKGSQLVAASGSMADVVSQSNSPGSTSSLAVEFAVGHVGEQEVGAVSAVEGMLGSKRIGAAGRGAVLSAAAGEQATAAVGEGGLERATLSAEHGSVIERTDGNVAATAVGAELISQARSSHLTEPAEAQRPISAHVVRTSSPSMILPNASLYTTNPAPSSRYLIVTDGRFADYRQWLGSDYMLDQLQMDPAVTQKRLGDAYYEQSLIRAQVTQLTGQRYLAGFTSDDEEYRALMDAGVAVAKSFNLRPGVALSEAQMAALTEDIVWMVEKEVTLADGSVQKVLAPQVYARVREGDLDGSGTLLAGKDVDVRLSGNLVNSGTIAGRNTARLAAENIQNMGGRIRSDVVSVAAANDLNNIGGVISANSALVATAGRDINVETTTRSATSSNGSNAFSRTSIDQTAGMYVTGDGSGDSTLVLKAGRDVNLVAAQIDNAGKEGATGIAAGRNLNLTTVSTESSNSISWGPKDYRKDNTTVEVGSQVQATGSIMLKAGVDLNARAADVQAGKSLTVTAGNDINLVAGVHTAKLDEGYQTDKKGSLNSKTIVTRDTLDRSSAVGSSFDGDTVNLVAGNDIKVLGSAVAGDGDANLTAGRAITIEAVTDTSRESHHRSVKEQGFLSGGGGFGISYGTRTTTTDQNQDATIQSGQARSMVGSISGSLNVNAGDAIKIAGSDLSAGKDIDLSGKSVAITAGVDDVNGKFTTKMTQDALTLAIGGSVVNAIQTAQAMNAAGNKTSSGRHQALAAAAAAMTANDVAQDMAKNGPSAKISLTVGHSESETTEVTTSRTHGGSVLAAGNNVTIVATGADKASNIDILGSDVRSANNVSLIADNQVNLLAAQDTESQHSQSKSWSAAVGVAAEINSQGARYGITASASASNSNINGEGTTQVNSHVTAGERLTIASGGDTNLKGAVASGGQVVANVNGSLNIESLQDTAKLDGKSQSVSVSGTVGAGGGVSASFSQSKVHNDYASVHEQSGIRAGDGGFQVTVGGNTDLKGAVISGTEQAIKDSHNSLATATLSFSDIENRDSTKASGFSLGVNIGKNQSGDTFSPSMAPGMGKVSDSQGSVTRSSVSDATLTVGGQQPGQAIANLNRDITTNKDTAQALTKSWNGTQALDDVNAQMQITSTAMPRLAKAIGDYAGVKEKELKNQGNVEEAAKWAEGGIYRVAAHTALGALGGGLNGAVGAAAVAEAAPTLKQLETAVKNRLADAGLDNNASDVVAKLVAGGAAGVIGTAAGGGAGAVTGLNVEVNNRQLHPDEKGRIKELAGGDPQKEARLTAAACALVRCYAEYPVGSKAYMELKQLADYGASAGFSGERTQLSKQAGMFVYTTTGVFSDMNIDDAKKLNSTYKIGTRAIGAGKVVLGAAGVVGSIASAPASCLTGIGCVANAAAATVSFDMGLSGGKELISGNPNATYFNQGLQSLGMSPEAAGWVEAGLGIGFAAKAASAANKLVDQSIAAEKLSRVTYFEKGTRPAPATYLTDGQINTHLANFENGGSYLVPKNVLDTYGREKLGYPDNSQFMMTKGEMDQLLARSGGNIAVLEKELGIPTGAWQGKELVRIDIPDPRAIGLRMPSGNEAGANALWLPGGKLPTGQLEAVVDAIPQGKYIERKLWDPKK